MSTEWTQAEAIELCRLFESIVPRYGFHVALTGGCLYKDGPRKDADVVIYRIRGGSEPDWAGMLWALEDCGLLVTKYYDFVTKCLWEGKTLDILYPECGDPHLIYPGEELLNHETDDIPL